MFVCMRLSDLNKLSRKTRLNSQKGGEELMLSLRRLVAGRGSLTRRENKSAQHKKEQHNRIGVHIYTDPYIF